MDDNIPNDNNLNIHDFHKKEAYHIKYYTDELDALIRQVQHLGNKLFHIYDYCMTSNLCKHNRI
jgi:hypothetical protein